MVVTSDVLKVLKLHSSTARAILKSFRTSLVAVNHEKKHSRSYDFLYLLYGKGFAAKWSTLIGWFWVGILQYGPLPWKRFVSTIIFSFFRERATGPMLPGSDLVPG